MCEELGNEDMMHDYIEEAGGTSLCAISDGSGCDDREKNYIEKMKSKSSDEVASQLERLEGMEGETMKADLMKWLKKRKKILKAMTKLHEEL
mmetsp:Transcript_24625/g.45556  ORF Transcript_24625/g.45556 Transcript_24625/m.45556 type:complete len:92 (+) Transcript_24625:415-690(+)